MKQCILLAAIVLVAACTRATPPPTVSADYRNPSLLFIGSLLSGAGGYPLPNIAKAWAKMVNGFQERAFKTRLGIPLIYGVDAVHGHTNVYGATVFPHNIGLGATRDPDLVERIGRATAVEMIATGILLTASSPLGFPARKAVAWPTRFSALTRSPANCRTPGRVR